MTQRSSADCLVTPKENKTNLCDSGNQKLGNFSSGQSAKFKTRLSSNDKKPFLFYGLKIFK